MNACTPVLVEDGSRCKLLRARHPLLDKDKAVPIDIAIGYAEPDPEPYQYRPKTDEPAQ